ncbi:hypothetical protein [Salinicola endophyticus]|uniref:Uncharacterized protein n=1 Tax=Salinicola endophyticus TaxID=1949083 RepID=A0AB74U2N2_9GAMM
MKDKYMGRINLKCDVCGGDQFSHESDEEIVCAECGKEYTKEELIDSNSEELDNRKDELLDDVKKDLEKSMKDIFRKWR